MANIYISTITPSEYTLEINLDDCTTDCTKDAGMLQSIIDAWGKRMQAKGYEEIEVVDFDSDEIPGIIATHISPENWVEYMEAYEEHGDAFRLYVASVCCAGQDVSDMVSGFEDAYRGEYDSKEDFAIELLDETGELNALPENLRHYFDYARYADDLFINDVYSEQNPNGGIFVYWNQ